MNNGSKLWWRRWWVVPALAASGLVLVLWIGDRYSAYQEEQDLRAHLAGSLRRVTYHSRVLRVDRHFLIYLPPGYGSPAGRSERYPTVYLLHGCPGQARDWVVKGHAHTTLERLILQQKVQPMILVFPDLEGPRGPFDCNGVMNRPDGTWSAEDSFFQDVVQRVDATYRTRADRDHRAVVGLSMGGFAALNLAARHPEVLGIACSISGYFRAGDFAPIARHVLGGRKDLWRANSPQETMANWRGKPPLHIYLDCGSEDTYLPNNRAFAERLIAQGIDCDLTVSRGAHTFSFWGRQLRSCLLFADQRFRAFP